MPLVSKYLIAADGKPLQRRVILLNATGIFSPSFLQLLSQTDYWKQGAKIAWVPNWDGTVHDILWAHPDPNEPVPDWVRRVPYFTMMSATLTTSSVSPWTVDPFMATANHKVEMISGGGNGAAGVARTNSGAG